MELVNESQGIKKKAKLFKKNMENAVESGKSILVFALAMTAASFLLCRVSFAGGFFPCGAALITALLYKNRLNIYLLPVMVLSMMTCYWANFYILGDLTATVLCGAAFVLFGRKKWGLMVFSLIAAMLTVMANCAYYLAANMFYRFDIRAMVLEAILIVILCHVFFFFLKVWFTGDKPVDTSMERIISATAAVAILLLCSMGLGNVMNLFSVTLIGGLFIILYVGYKFGVLAGVTAAGIAGIAMALCEITFPSLILNLMCGGVTAGFFKGQSRVYTSICFAGACLAPSLISGHPELAMPVYAPLAAGVLMVLMRKKWLVIVNPMEEGLRKEEVQNDVRVKDKVEITLSNALKSFASLANLYGGRKDSRAVMGYQYSGMTVALQSLLNEVQQMERTAVVIDAPQKYIVKSGAAGYAREGRISGDSYICKELGHDRYVMLLSDGMGKGEAAAVESGLTVRTLATLLDAGYDPESAIKSINSISLMNADQEIFSTIDMGILDQKTGKLRLFKVGAAATFIKRRDKVLTVKMNALPMGIVDGLHIDYINVRLHKGDQLIMVSDGIIDSCREDLSAEWLMDTIAQVKSKDPQTMADLIINKAVENYGLKEKDDLTVLSFRMD